MSANHLDPGANRTHDLRFRNARLSEETGDSTGPARTTEGQSGPSTPQQAHNGRRRSAVETFTAKQAARAQLVRDQVRPRTPKPARRDVPLSLHDQLAANWAERVGGSRKRFVPGIKALLKKMDELDGEDTDAGLVLDEWEDPGFIPDAWVASKAPADDFAEHHITACEVEITSPVTTDKLERYARLWWSLEYALIRLRLVVIDRHGRESEVDLMHHAYETLTKEPMGPMRFLAPVAEVRQ